jgi:hypothetical protein
MRQDISGSRLLGEDLDRRPKPRCLWYTVFVVVQAHATEANASNSIRGAAGYTRQPKRPYSAPLRRYARKRRVEAGEMVSPATALPPASSDQDGEHRPWTPKLKLQGLGPNDLPPHPDLASHQASPPELSLFLIRLLEEVQRHIEIKSTDIGTSKDSVTARGSAYPIVVHKTKCKDGEGLLWFGRRSEHEEGKPVGFEELRGVMMRDHERNEAEYTPAVYGVNVLVDWKGELSGREFRWEGGDVGDVEMRGEFGCFLFGYLYLLNSKVLMTDGNG